MSPTTWVLLKLLLLCAGLVTVVVSEGDYKADGRPNVHTVFLTDCTPYSDWMSLGMAYSYRFSGQIGPLTKVMCCTPEEKEAYVKNRKPMLDYVNTHIARSFAHNDKTGDHYAAYNKPGAVVDWLEHVDPEEEWILVIDSDMILRRPFLPDTLKPEIGKAISASYTYMAGVNNELALRHVPEIDPRNDSLAGPPGRRGDQVGGFIFMHKDDLKKLAPLWLNYTERVREDPESYKYANDDYAKKPGDKPWISEMYGYAFGAAKANVWHKWDPHAMVYPAYTPGGVPRLLHFGLDFHIATKKDYEFDKHWFYQFEVLTCPPWDLVDRPKAGLFPNPPHPDELKDKDWIQRYTDVLASQVAATVNAGLCDFHRRNCPTSEQMDKECDVVAKLHADILKELDQLDAEFSCTDHLNRCAEWAQGTGCEHNHAYMQDHCRVSCKVCDPSLIKHIKAVEDKRSDKVIPLAKEAEHRHEDQQQTTDSQGKDMPASSPAAQATEQAKANEPVVKQPAEVTKPETQPSPAEPPKTVITPDAAAGAKTIEVVKAPEVGKPAVVEKQKEEKPIEPIKAPTLAVDPKQAEGSKPTDRQEATEARQASTEVPEKVKELLKRCHRMTSLTLEQVRHCQRDATNGLEYTPPEGKQPLARTDIKTIRLQDGATTKGKTDQAVAPPTALSSSALPVWQTVGLWLVLGSVVLTLVPQFLKRRKLKSRRSE